MPLYLGNIQIKDINVGVISADNLQQKTVNPTETQITVTSDSGYIGLSSVTVNAISSTYIGSSINQYTDNGNITLNATTTSKSYPAGYYLNAHGAEHTTVNIPSPTISVSSAGLITASGSWSAGFTSDTSYTKTTQLTVKSTTTYTPSTTNQTISSGIYLTGDQIILGDTNLIASNIISTATIFGVSGSVVIQKYYTGASTPSSTTGSNGDVYLQT